MPAFLAGACIGRMSFGSNRRRAKEKMRTARRRSREQVARECSLRETPEEVVHLSGIHRGSDPFGPRAFGLVLERRSFVVRGGWTARPPRPGHCLLSAGSAWDFKGICNREERRSEKHED